MISDSHHIARIRNRQLLIEIDELGIILSQIKIKYEEINQKKDTAFVTSTKQISSRHHYESQDDLLLPIPPEMSTTLKSDSLLAFEPDLKKFENTGTVSDTIQEIVKHSNSLETYQLETKNMMKSKEHQNDLGNLKPESEIKLAEIVTSENIREELPVIVPSLVISRKSSISKSDPMEKITTNVTGDNKVLEDFPVRDEKPVSVMSSFSDDVSESTLLGTNSADDRRLRKEDAIYDFKRPYKEALTPRNSILASLLGVTSLETNQRKPSTELTVGNNGERQQSNTDINSKIKVTSNTVENDYSLTETATLPKSKNEKSENNLSRKSSRHKSFKLLESPRSQLSSSSQKQSPSLLNSRRNSTDPKSSSSPALHEILSASDVKLASSRGDNNIPKKTINLISNDVQAEKISLNSEKSSILAFLKESEPSRMSDNLSEKSEENAWYKPKKASEKKLFISSFNAFDDDDDSFSYE